MSEANGSVHEITNAYHGTEVQPQYRGTVACEKLWNKETNLGTFDELIVKQLENAKSQGRTKVTVLDIGSGQANLFKDFLSDTKLGEKTREFLKGNKNFNIELIGITDAKSLDEVFTEQEIKATSSDIDNSQIMASNIKYTLSFRQRVANVLTAKGIEGIDLCLSTVALTYLGPATFENTITDVIEKLTPKGEMIVYEYAGIAPGIIQPDAMFLGLDIRNIQTQGASLKATLAQHSMRFGQLQFDIEKEEEQLARAEDLMIRVGATSREEIEKRRAESMQQADTEGTQQWAFFRRATCLLADERTLITKHIEKLRHLKEGIVSTLIDRYSNSIDGELYTNTIHLTKK